MKIRLWFFLTLTIMIAFLTTGISSGNEFFFALLMSLISFPLGAITFCIWVGFHMWYESAYGCELAMSSYEYIILWIGFSSLGYVQWFKLTPYFFDKLSNAKHNHE